MEIYIEALEENFLFVQKLIEEIKSKDKLDIKQISDLQRFCDMQKSLSVALEAMNNIE